MKYFANITTAEELKAEFRRLSIELHPDRNSGQDTEFKNMLQEYEQAQSRICGFHTEFKHSRSHSGAVGLRRGVAVVFFGPGMNETEYIITSVTAEYVEMVRLFSHDFASLEDVEFYDEDSSHTKKATEYAHIEPLSKKFGIGYYWDDIDGKTYTEEEIKEAERVAANFDKWIKIKEEQEAEEARKAQEESDRAEAAIIAEWSHILEQLPPLHKSKTWQELNELPRAERKAQQDADKKADRKANAQRLAAFKRNIKAVFNHYFPGVKVSVKDSAKCWCESSVIEWEDGPTVAEVEAVEAFDYFRAHGWAAATPWEDYGHITTRHTLEHFRELFGAWSDNEIKYTRIFSEETKNAVNAVISSIIPDYEGKGHEELINTDDAQAESVIQYFGFDFSEPWRNDMTKDEETAYFEREREHEEERGRIRRVIAPTFQQWSGEAYGRNIYAIFTDYYRMPQEAKKTTTRKAEPQKTQNEPTGANDAEILAERDGLQLVTMGEGVAVVGDTRTTYRNRKAIKAHGATWNRDAQQWQGTTPEAVASLREWFGLSDDENTQQEQTATTTEEAPQQEATEGAHVETMGENLAGAFVDFLNVCGDLHACHLWDFAEDVEPIEETPSNKDANTEPQGDKFTISFAVDDVPELDELNEPTDPGSTPTGGAPDGGAQMTEEEREKTRRHFEIYAKHAEEATEDNEHTTALIWQATALIWNHKDKQAAQLLNELEAMKDRHEKRGHITPEDYNRRHEIHDLLITLCVAEYGADLAAVLFGRSTVNLVLDEIAA